ncbi:MAG: phosphoribosyltransferase [Deferribacteraceae bacterium]|jgi:hypothetical protein|nr:phosphoribosyltransferase [Deferribacteraceae bacterium]
MHKFTIYPNKYLSQKIQAFYHIDYLKHKKPGNPDYLVVLKNTYKDTTQGVLKTAVKELESVLTEDLPGLFQILQLSSLTVCVVPRAKALYKPAQLLFKATVSKIVKQLDGFIDGSDYIIRHTDTRTTHLKNYDKQGDMPYPGITEKTCNISEDAAGKDILLVDDIYTKTINVDEDVIQALLNRGARSLTFYAVGHTVYRYANELF